jgi:hypothetical protein
MKRAPSSRRFSVEPRSGRAVLRAPPGRRGGAGRGAAFRSAEPIRVGGGAPGDAGPRLVRGAAPRPDGPRSARDQSGSRPHRRAPQGAAHSRRSRRRARDGRRGRLRRPRVGRGRGALRPLPRRVSELARGAFRSACPGLGGVSSRPHGLGPGDLDPFRHL